MSRRRFASVAATGAWMGWAGKSAVPSAAPKPAARAADDPVVVRPMEYRLALRNPLMGFRPELGPKAFEHDYATLVRQYIRWNQIENAESDGEDQIREFCHDRWRGLAEANFKVIPRVYLHWSAENEKYWPADLRSGDYTSAEFRHRLMRLVGRLGECWDTDARVAYVQMGLIGKWGEHHDPDVSDEMQRLLGQAFAQAFKRKPVMVRHPWDFKGFNFGIYWDSFAHSDQMKTHGAAIEAISPRWKSAPIGGEVAYDWGHYQIQPGKNPDDTVTDAGHRTHLVNTIRRLHANHLGWVADYSRQLPAARVGAEEVQRAFGYRFQLDQATFPAQWPRGKPVQIGLQVRNLGSTPFYSDWPLEVSLLDPESRNVTWAADFSGADLRRCLPGDDWDADGQIYRIAPEPIRIRGEFSLPPSFPKGRYLLALAILDPAGRRPSARFSTVQYFTGGRHPIGQIGVELDPGRVELGGITFDDPASDRTLHYLA